MKTEIEAKFVDVDIDAVRESLKALGGVCEQPMRLMRRYTFDNANMKQKDAFLRLRHEGHKTTLTYKQFKELSVTGAREIELEVSDFDAMYALLNAVENRWLRQSFQESKRETWQVGEAEVMIDEWPWLKPYIEVEAGSEDEVMQLAQQLGFSWTDAVFGDVMAAYRVQYPHLGEKDTIGNLAEVRFGTELPRMFLPQSTL